MVYHPFFVINTIPRAVKAKQSNLMSMLFSLNTKCPTTIDQKTLNARLMTVIMEAGAKRYAKLSRTIPAPYVAD